MGDKLQRDNMFNFQLLETVKVLKLGIKRNREEKWWLKKEYQPKEYQDNEIERATNKILQIFDDQWVEDVLNEWLRDQRRHHLMIGYLIEKGSYPLSILVGLGKDLIEIESLKNIEILIKNLKNGTKFISSAFEAELAAECVRKGFNVELYPELYGKIPDLKVIFDSKIVYFEITEIHPSQRIHSFYKIRNDLFRCISQLVPENTRIRLNPNRLISNGQFNQIEDRLKSILKNNPSFPTSFHINDLIVEVEKEKDEWGKSLFVVIPSKLIDLELKRLKEKIKKKARRISEPYLGVIVVDATNTLSAFRAVGLRIKEGINLTSNLSMDIILDVVEPFDKETEYDKEIEIINKIKDNIKEIFEQRNYSNILAVMVIRSFKFVKKKNEVIMVENPYCEELQLLEKIKDLHAFSRTTNL